MHRLDAAGKVPMCWGGRHVRRLLLQHTGISWGFSALPSASDLQLLCFMGCGLPQLRWLEQNNRVSRASLLEVSSSSAQKV